jgi:hypothetical protein
LGCRVLRCGFGVFFEAAADFADGLAEAVFVFDDRQPQVAFAVFAEAAQFGAAQQQLYEGKLRTHPIRIMPGGLHVVLEGMGRLQKNEISGEKLVYHVHSVRRYRRLRSFLNGAGD